MASFISLRRFPGGSRLAYRSFFRKAFCHELTRTLTVVSPIIPSVIDNNATTIRTSPSTCHDDMRKWKHGTTHNLIVSRVVSTMPMQQQIRYFSQQQPRERLTANTSEQTHHDVDDVATAARSLSRAESSILRKFLPQTYTPGQALSIIRTHKAGGRPIRHSDFRRLCLASRPNEFKDARVIHTALLEFKRCNSFVLRTHDSSVALQGMLRSLLPVEESGDVDGKDKVKAALYCGEAFLDEKTGLYFATRTESVDKLLLKVLLDGVRNLKADGTWNDFSMQKITGHKKEETKDSPTATTEEKEEDQIMGKEIVRVTRAIFESLLRRGFKTPNKKKMKKKAANKYRKLICVDHRGPLPTTLDLAVRIVLEADFPAAKARALVNMFKVTQIPPLEETLMLIKEAQENETAAAIDAAIDEAAAIDAAIDAAAASVAEEEHAVDSSPNETDSTTIVATTTTTTDIEGLAGEVNVEQHVGDSKKDNLSAVVDAAIDETAASVAEKEHAVDSSPNETDSTATDIEGLTGEVNVEQHVGDSKKDNPSADVDAAIDEAAASVAEKEHSVDSSPNGTDSTTTDIEGSTGEVNVEQHVGDSKKDNSSTNNA